MDNYGEMLIYQTEEGLTKIDVNMYDETVWLSIDQMAEFLSNSPSLNIFLTCFPITLLSL